MEICISCINFIPGRALFVSFFCLEVLRLDGVAPPVAAAAFLFRLVWISQRKICLPRTVLIWHADAIVGINRNILKHCSTVRLYLPTRIPVVYIIGFTSSRLGGIPIHPRWGRIFVVISTGCPLTSTPMPCAATPQPSRCRATDKSV